MHFQVKGLFFAAGRVPSTGFLNGQVKLDSDGYIITEPGTCTTSVPGVFAAGNVADPTYRQVATCMGTGCMAALQAIKYVTILKSKPAA